ncbi:MAG: hypothetical protein HC828_02760 [Blastochloris sp.]|nr:hypothetical protein [Blastochloris sp.]
MARPTRRIRRLLRLGALGLLALIILVLGLSAFSNLGLPTHSAVADRLDASEQARLAEALHLRQELGAAVWPGWDTAAIPLVVYNEGYAFALGHPDPPRGWREVPSGEQHGAVWQAVPDDTFAGQPYFRQPLADGDATPQAFTVRLGDRWAASMTTYEWTRIALADHLRQELPTPLRPVFPYRLFVGQFISDWYIAALAHESFHAFQGMQAPDRLAAAENAVRRDEPRYPWDEQLAIDAWRVELELLVAASQASDEQVAALATDFLKHRAERRATLGLSAALIDYEQQREWLEGLGKYAELALWRAAATTPGYQPLDAMAADADFDAYASFEQHWNQELAQAQRMADDHGDGRFYYTGMLQAFLLDRLMPAWKTRAFDTTLDALLAEAVSQRTTGGGS